VWGCCAVSSFFARLSLLSLLGSVDLTLETFSSRFRLSTLARSEATIAGRLWLHGLGKITTGRGVVFRGGVQGIELQTEPGAELVIGNDVTIGPGTSIEVSERIEIGDGCRIGSYCKLLDNHLHPVRGSRLYRPESTPIVLGPNVVVGDYAVILPGAVIGEGAHIGRGVVVSRRVPPNARLRDQPVHPSRET
jgi:acetyltransferase-like isoleucine patch superfamily enzyme